MVLSLYKLISVRNDSCVDKINILFGIAVILQVCAIHLKRWIIKHLTIIFKIVAKICRGTSKIKHHAIIIKQPVITSKFSVIKTQKNQVSLWSDKEDRFALVGFTDDFWHKIKNLMKTKLKLKQCLDITTKDFFLYIDLTTWPNLTKFCSLTLAGASPRTPWWMLGCLKTQT